nr:hypothetical protein [Tanacetum cinerariifolium]
MTSDGSNQDVRYALSKLLQRGMVAEYESEFLMLIKRVTGISESLLKSESTLHEPTTLGSVGVLSFNFGISLLQKLWELLRSYPLTLREAFVRARITEACFEDENNQVVDTNIGDPGVKDKQEVKKADDQEIKNIKDEEGKIVEDQQVSEADDDTNNDDFGCSLPPHKGVDLTVEEVVFENIKSDFKKDEDEQGKKKE